MWEEKNCIVNVIVFLKPWIVASIDRWTLRSHSIEFSTNHLKKSLFETLKYPSCQFMFGIWIPFIEFHVQENHVLVWCSFSIRIHYILNTLIQHIRRSRFVTLWMYEILNSKLLNLNQNFYWRIWLTSTFIDVLGLHQQYVNTLVHCRR